jgi:hypothetical protein
MREVTTCHHTIHYLLRRIHERTDLSHYLIRRSGCCMMVWTMHRTWPRKTCGRGGRRRSASVTEMDAMEKGYDNDMYDSIDFDQIKNIVDCSVYHGEGHTMHRHKEEPKRN